MSDDGPPPTDDSMCATYRALCRHGYADLTMQDIADESTKSKATLHYHYDTKRDLLCAFLDHLFERFTDRLDDVESGDAPGRLRSLVDTVLDPPREDVNQEFRTALLEMKVQAPYDGGFRDRLARFDDTLHDRVAAVVREGVAEGAFTEDVDPETTATLVVTLLDGAHVRRVTRGDDDERDVRAAINEFVDERLVAEEGRAEELPR